MCDILCRETYLQEGLVYIVMDRWIEMLGSSTIYHLLRELIEHNANNYSTAIHYLSNEKRGLKKTRLV